MKCPDCGAEPSTVTIEVFSSKAFDVDHEQKLLIPKSNHEWDYGDYCCHCPHCNSLNVDEMLKDYELQDGYRNII